VAEEKERKGKKIICPIVESIRNQRARTFRESSEAAGSLEPEVMTPDEEY
jgi:hypothetical protein